MVPFTAFRVTRFRALRFRLPSFSSTYSQSSAASTPPTIGPTQ